MLVDVFSLLAVSFERFMAIVFPFRPRMGHLAAYVTCGVIWVLSLATASPLITARVYKVLTFEYYDILLLEDNNNRKHQSRNGSGKTFWKHGASITFRSRSFTTSASTPFWCGFH